MMQSVEGSSLRSCPREVAREVLFPHKKGILMQLWFEVQNQMSKILFGSMFLADLSIEGNWRGGIKERKNVMQYYSISG